LNPFSGVSKRLAELTSPVLFDSLGQRHNPAMRHVWPWPQLLLESAAKLINRLPQGRWLDAACGEGQLADLVKSSHSLLGIDIDPMRLGRARGHPYRSLVNASVTSLPVADNIFDGIASIETLEHVDDLASALADFARCIKPGGHLIVTMPSVTLRSFWQMRQNSRPVYCDAEQHVRELSPIEMKGFDHKFVTFQWFENELARFGFSVIKRLGVGCLFPMWTGQLAWLEHGHNLLYREKVNSVLAKMPLIGNYAYYRLFGASFDRAA